MADLPVATTRGRAIAAAAVLVVAVVAVIAVVAAGGGDELDHSQVERDVSRYLTSRLDSPTTAGCPPGVEKKPGTSFTCTGVTAGGGRVRVDVRQGDDGGTLKERVRSARYENGALVASIRGYYRENRARLGYAVASVSCPTAYDAAIEDRLTCRARYSDGVKAKIHVTVDGPANRFTWFEVDTPANKGSSG